MFANVTVFVSGVSLRLHARVVPVRRMLVDPLGSRIVERDERPKSASAHEICLPRCMSS